MLDNRYTTGAYLDENPTWHTEDSPWKAQQILRMLERNKLQPRTVGEVGCGAGEILRQLQHQMSAECVFYGYEISPQAFGLCRQRVNERLHCANTDLTQVVGVFYDLLLIIDVVEHLEDYFSFLRALKPKSQYKILHIPLELSVLSLMRSRTMLMAGRSSLGHIHYFTKEIALSVLQDTGYEVVDYFYTHGYSGGAARSGRAGILGAPRKLIATLNEGWAERTIGGLSLMVLVK